MELPRENQKFTIRDYLMWPDGERWELIDGVAYAMSGPRTAHQRLVRRILTSLDVFLEGKPCEPFAAPFDVYLGDAEDTVVQPDLLVVCDPAKIHDKGIVGAPDLIVEVLSPSTASYDFVQKMLLYQREGVKEYWIVSPEEKKIFKNVLENGIYSAQTFASGMLTCALLPEYELDIDALFALLEDLPE